MKLKFMADGKKTDRKRKHFFIGVCKRCYYFSIFYGNYNECPVCEELI